MLSLILTFVPSRPQVYRQVYYKKNFGILQGKANVSSILARDENHDGNINTKFRSPVI